MFKKVIPGILSILLLVGCGAASEVPTMEEQAVEEISVSEEAPVVQPETKEEEKVSAPDYPEEADIIKFDLFYDDDMTLSSAEFRLEDEDSFFTSGDILNAAAKTMPRSYASHDDHTVITYSGPEASLIKNYFDYGYRFYVADKEQVVNDTFKELLQETQGKTDEDILATAPIDITDGMSKSLCFVRNDDGAITQLKVSKAEMKIENVTDSKVEGPTIVFVLPEGALSDVYVYMDELFYGIKTPSDTLKSPDNNGEHSVSNSNEIIGKWYPERTDFNEYYIQIDKGGTGSIHRDDEVFQLKYTFDGHTLTITDENGGSRDFYYSEGELVSDVDGEIYRPDKPKEITEVSPGFDLTGTWYDPTGLSTAEYIFNGDGTGTLSWGRDSTSISVTYSVSGNKVNIQLTHSTDVLTIVGDKLSDGESNYVKR